MIRLVMLAVLAVGLIAIGVVLSNYLRAAALRRKLSEKVRLEKDLDDFLNQERG
jgi:hypothetical protein